VDSLHDLLVKTLRQATTVPGGWSGS
jgi:hypothetical protein